MYECNDKMVSHPDHYQSETGMEVIDVIEAFTFDLTGIEAVDTGNALKYLCRWKKKNGLQDLKKARWYLEHLIDHVEKLEEENKYIDHDIKTTERISGRYPWHFDHGYIFSTRKDAEEVLDYMLDTVGKCGVVTVAQLRERCGMIIDISQHECGWTNLNSATISICDGGYRLELPRAIYLLSECKFINTEGE